MGRTGRVDGWRHDQKKSLAGDGFRGQGRPISHWGDRRAIPGHANPKPALAPGRGPFLRPKTGGEKFRGRFFGRRAPYRDKSSWGGTILRDNRKKEAIHGI